MFEKGKAIREAKKAEILGKERKRIQKALEKHGVTLSPEAAEAAFGDQPENAS